MTIPRTPRRPWPATLSMLLLVLCGLIFLSPGAARADHSPSVSWWQSVGLAGVSVHSLAVGAKEAGLTWRPFGHHLDDGGAIMSLTVTRDHIYVGTMGNALWRASMSIATWQKVVAGMPEVNDHGSALATIPGHTGTIYVGTIGFGVFRTTDSGAHWKNLSAGLSVANNATVIRSMAYPGSQHTLYLGTDDGVYVLAPV